MCESPFKNVAVSQIKLIRKYLKLKILEDNISFRNHNLDKNHVYDLIKRTVLCGESHSALMIGPRGSGKTCLVNTVLHQLKKEVDLLNDAIVIKLNGLLHHDEKMALKSITAQMQLENAVGDRVFGTFAENLSFLLSCLQSGQDRSCKSMVFLLDQVDMFCHSGRTQTLLYNLFDITHAQRAPICVLGITNRLDVMELLEKRVKSRFSHRHIFLFPNEGSESESNMNINSRAPLDSCKEVFVQQLSMPLILGKNEDKMEHTPKKKKGRLGKKLLKGTQDTPMEIDSNLQDFSVPDEVLARCRIDVQQFNKLNLDVLQDWNAHVRSLADDESVVDSLEKLCYYTVNEQIFRDVLFQIVCTLSPTKPYLEAFDAAVAVDKAVAPEHRVKLLQSLSILELSLVIAMKHGMEIFDGQPMNFEMVLHRYTKFANTNSSTQTVPRPVILKAFEHLQVLEIIMPVRSTDHIYNAGDTTASRVQKEYQLYTLAVPVEDIQEAVKNFKALPTEISHWFNNSVV